MNKKILTCLLFLSLSTHSIAGVFNDALKDTVKSLVKEFGEKGKDPKEVEKFAKSLAEKGAKAAATEIIKEVFSKENVAKTALKSFLVSFVGPVMEGPFSLVAFGAEGTVTYVNYMRKWGREQQLKKFISAVITPSKNSAELKGNWSEYNNEYHGAGAVIWNDRAAVEEKKKKLYEAALANFEKEEKIEEGKKMARAALERKGRKIRLQAREKVEWANNNLGYAEYEFSAANVKRFFKDLKFQKEVIAKAKINKKRLEKEEAEQWKREEAAEAAALSEKEKITEKILANDPERKKLSDIIKITSGKGSYTKKFGAIDQNENNLFAELNGGKSNITIYKEGTALLESKRKVLYQRCLKTTSKIKKREKRRKNRNLCDDNRNTSRLLAREYVKKVQNKINTTRKKIETIDKRISKRDRSWYFHTLMKNIKKDGSVKKYQENYFRLSRKKAFKDPYKEYLYRVPSLEGIKGLRNSAMRNINSAYQVRQKTKKLTAKARGKFEDYKKGFDEDIKEIDSLYEVDGHFLNKKDRKSDYEYIRSEISSFYTKVIASNDKEIITSNAYYTKLLNREGFLLDLIHQKLDPEIEKNETYIKEVESLLKKSKKLIQLDNQLFSWTKNKKKALAKLDKDIKYWEKTRKESVWKVSTKDHDKLVNIIKEKKNEKQFFTEKIISIKSLKLFHDVVFAKKEREINSSLCSINTVIKKDSGSFSYCLVGEKKFSAVPAHIKIKRDLLSNHEITIKNYSILVEKLKNQAFGMKKDKLKFIVAGETKSQAPLKIWSAESKKLSSSFMQVKEAYKALNLYILKEENIGAYLNGGGVNLNFKLKENIIFTYKKSVEARRRDEKKLAAELINYLKNKNVKLFDILKARISRFGYYWDKPESLNKLIREFYSGEVGDTKEAQFLKDKPLIEKLYKNFEKYYSNKNESQLMSLLSDNWRASDGTSVLDLEENFRRNFRIFNEIKCTISGLLIDKNFKEMRGKDERYYTIRYKIKINGEIYDQDIEREEVSQVTEQVVINDKKRVKILSTSGGSFWLKE